MNSTENSIAQPSRQRICVPFTLTEWESVRNDFLSNEKEELEKTIELLNMWKCRMGRNTPIVIEITELVLRAIAVDKFCDANNALAVSNAALILSAVIIRFINYVNEVCQPVGGKLISIAQAVSKRNIPEWVVKIRHDAAHSHMPPLSLLRKAVDFCRKWLWKEHWKLPTPNAIFSAIPAEAVDGVISKKNMKDSNRIKQAFEQYTQWRNKSPTRIWTDDELRNQNSLSVLFEVVTNKPFIVLEMLSLSEGVLVMTKEQMNAADVQWNLAPDGSHIFDVPENVQHYWQPLMQILAASNCLDGLLVKITQNIGERCGTDIQLSQLAGWADKLMSAFLHGTNTLSVHAWQKILSSCIFAPEYFHKAHIKGILKRLENEISNTQYKRLLRLLELPAELPSPLTATIDLGELEDCEFHDESTYSVKTVDDLRQLMQSAREPFVKCPLTGRCCRCCHLRLSHAIGVCR
jgi:hypothetical protein